MNTEQSGLEGNDPVAYQTEGRAIQGEATHTHKWQGKTWHFVSDSNRETFAQNPEKYAPQYNGQCAFAVSLGKTEVGSPKYWHVRDGKLYLCSNPVAKFLWKILPGRPQEADKRWSATLSA